MNSYCFLLVQICWSVLGNSFTLEQSLVVFFFMAALQPEGLELSCGLRSEGAGVSLGFIAEAVSPEVLCQLCRGFCWAGWDLVEELMKEMGAVQQWEPQWRVHLHLGLCPCLQVCCAGIEALLRHCFLSLLIGLCFSVCSGCLPASRVRQFLRIISLLFSCISQSQYVIYIKDQSHFLPLVLGLF